MPPTPPESAAEDVCRFAHLTDPHLTDLSRARFWELRGKRLLSYLSWRRKRRFEHRREILDSLVAHLRQAAPQQILVSGDLTHIGLTAEFLEAARWLGELGAAEDVCVVPGNHELCLRRGAAGKLALWQNYLRGDGAADAGFPSLRSRAGVAFIGVSSAVATAPLLASGRVDAAQRLRLTRCLQDCSTRGLFRVVYIHHCPLPGVDRWRKRLSDSKAVSELLSEAGAELVLHGHGHRSIDNRLATRDGEALVLGGASASAAGRYGGEPAGYRAFEVQRVSDGWRLQVKRFRFDTQRGAVLPAQDAAQYSFPRRHAAFNVEAA